MERDVKKIPAEKRAKRLFELQVAGMADCRLGEAMRKASVAASYMQKNCRGKFDEREWDEYWDEVQVAIANHYESEVRRLKGFTDNEPANTL